VIVHSLLQIKYRSARDWLCLPLLHLANPDALALGASVLLQHAGARGDGVGEALLEGRDVIVGKSVAHATGEIFDLHQCILGAHLLDDVRMRHDRFASVSHLPQQPIHFSHADALIFSGVDAYNDSIHRGQLPLDLLIISVAVENGLSCPVLFPKCITDGDGVTAVSVWSFI